MKWRAKTELLKKFYSIKDNSNGYGSQRNSDAARESMELVMAEGGLNA